MWGRIEKRGQQDKTPEQTSGVSLFQILKFPFFSKFPVDNSPGKTYNKTKYVHLWKWVIF